MLIGYKSKVQQSQLLLTGIMLAMFIFFSIISSKTKIFIFVVLILSIKKTSPKTNINMIMTGIMLAMFTALLGGLGQSIVHWIRQLLIVNTSATLKQAHSLTIIPFSVNFYQFCYSFIFRSKNIFYEPFYSYFNFL